MPQTIQMTFLTLALRGDRARTPPIQVTKTQIAVGVLWSFAPMAVQAEDAPLLTKTLQTRALPLLQ